MELLGQIGGFNQIISAAVLVLGTWFIARNKASQQVHDAEAKLRKYLEEANDRLRIRLAENDEVTVSLREKYLSLHEELTKYRIEVHDLRSKLSNIEAVQQITLRAGGRRHYDPPIEKNNTAD